MRQRYLALLSVFASLPAMALTFQTRLESIEWTVEGDKFECRLSQPITDFGSGEFVRKAGEQATFRLKAYNPMLGGGSATLLAAAAPWQPGRGDINLGSVRIGSGDVLFNSSQIQAGRLISGLMEGRSPVIRRNTEDGRVSEVRLLPVRFNKAFNDYQGCVAKLLPKNFEQIKQTQIGFPGEGVELDAQAKAQLQVMLDFIKADPSVNHVELDGHSDNSGNRLTNRELSRRRALAVMDFFKANGFQESQFTVRFHGERYPLVPNTNAANRAKNRRVVVQLERVAATQAPAPQPPTAAPAPATPAVAPAAAPGKAPTPVAPAKTAAPAAATARTS
ncbi:MULTISPECIES: flagellar protein MotY [Pseudomonas]|uniref:flagellar protein MotY n=1 Tax=Pseudomonas TaxID=286 RepID=UPI000345CCFE|nr:MULTISPECIES: OmpA family protein [Pseudomonas]MBL3542575.1 OmpA family protein [Pseudomonas sp. HB05]MBJ2349515.1 OmpA family protein [Pseudomonas canavaninivorans]MBJ2349710.1 OmpA family protein [Pseudomonas canavaninivorans]MBJ2350100.1 OmpA family protein [Pseudomonas canavaninivorans]UVM73767.1 OmpA family protein [Pseudomonas canavaninivorans]